MSRLKWNDGYIYMEVLFSILLVVVLTGSLYLAVKPAGEAVNREEKSVESLISAGNSYYSSQDPLYE